MAVGVLQSIYLRTSSSYSGQASLCEALNAVRQLRRVMRPAYQIEVHVNQHAIARLSKVHPPWRSLWDRVRMLSLNPQLRALMRHTNSQRVVHLPYISKLAALMNTGFERALFLDNDVRLLDASLVHSLLTATLGVADVAMPLDPGRELFARKQAGQGAPFLCSCLLAYHNTNAVRAWWQGAAVRLIEGRHPHIRQTDQEMIWFEWVHNRSHLRVLALPEEYYCPMKPGSTGTEWHTSGYPMQDYQCKSTHVHAARIQLHGGCSK